MADAGGAFITRAFERMLKDSTKKQLDLQKSLRTYLDRPQLKKKKAAPAPAKPATKPAAALPEEGSEGAPASLPPDASPPRSTPPATSPATSPASSPPPAPTAGNSAAATMGLAGQSLEGPELELVVLPMKLAMEAKQAKLVEPALDCLHKLIAYGHLEGEAGVEGGRKSVVMTDLLNMVCACGADPTSADSVVLSAIKVLLTAVASNTFCVHGDSLLSAIDTCCNIVLHGKSVTNQRTAKTTLTQMIDTVFKRMESDTKVKARAQRAAAKPATLARSTSSLPSVAIGGSVSGGDKAATSPRAVADSKDAGPSTSRKVGGEGEEGEGEKGANDPAAVSLEELQHMAADADVKGLEAALEKVVEHSTQASQPAAGSEEVILTEQDALLVFRTLCKMSMNEGADEASVRSKVLALELLLSLLESVGDSFTVDVAFVEAIRQHLCYSLVRACVSPTPTVFQLACSVFAILLLRFRESLKAEIGIFFPLIVLRSLDSAETPLKHRTAVLRMLEVVCRDRQMLADVFVNYDCDLAATNLLERMVSSLSRIAQGTPGIDPSTIQLAQNVALKESSLRCLVTALGSMVAWAKRGADAAKAAAALGGVTQPARSSLELEEGGAGGPTDEAAEGDVTALLMSAKAHKSNVEAAVAEFNLKPSKGIKLLISNKLVENDPKSIATFLRTTTGLDKVQVGDYLGHHEEFNIKVMHAYVDDMDFANLAFDDAIREFLKGFRLPGEAQKIDRMMEKFAERYCRDNPGLFKNADTAYVLAYAVIMLNTDAHNPMVWPKMTKADFVRINSGSSSSTATEAESEAAPVPMLEQIYDSIVSNEIKMKDDLVGGAGPQPGTKHRSSMSRGGGGLADFGLVNVLNLAVPRRRGAPGEGRDTNLESEAIVQKTQSLFSRDGAGMRGVFHRAENVELVKPMLEAVGWPLLAAFSVTMEDADNRSRVSLCMEGFRLGIHLCKLLSMETMRYAFLTSLVRFTFLHAPRDMRTKNMEALRTLLQLAEQEPDALQDAWHSVLECISRLEFVTTTPAAAATLMAAANQVSRDALLMSLTELAGTPSERVFISSVKLPSDAIVEFFTALCGVSAEELKQSPPRVYSLQKLVEIAYYNMPRIRMVWARIWSVLSSHFVAAGQHHDQKIAMYAIDSLRQLGIKYLERSELSNFTFQNDIMKPFVIVMRNSRQPMIRELIVQCIVQMIKSKVGSIKSGWRSVFMVFTTAASDSVENIVDSSFENVEQVVLEHFDQVVGDCFLDCVNCLIAFANNKVSADISLKAISMLRICEDRLAEGFIPSGDGKSEEENGKVTDNEVAEYYWFPMLAGLSDLTSDPRDKVRGVALEVLFDLLTERGKSFSGAFWESIYHRVLFPMFDYVRHVGKDGTAPGRPNEWLRQTCLHCLELLCDLFCGFYKDVSFLLPALLGLLLDCATRPDQGLAAISIAALVRLMDVGGSQFKEKEWAAFIESIRNACAVTCPVELVSLDLDIWGGDQASGQNSQQRTPAATSAPPPLRQPFATPAEQQLSDAALAAAAEAVTARSPRASYASPEPPNGIKSPLRGSVDFAARLGEPRATAPLDADGSNPASPSKLRGRGNGGGLGSPPLGVMSAASPGRGDGEGSERGMPDGMEGSLGGGSWGKSLAQKMMDTLLMKNVSMKGKGRPTDAPILMSPPPASLQEEDEDGIVDLVLDDMPPQSALEVVRTKCLAQLLLLDALDRLQKGHWSVLGPSEKLTLIDIIQTIVDFAAAYDSDVNLCRRMQSISSDRPPPSLLRLELEGTQLYMSVLLRTLEDPAADHMRDFGGGQQASANGGSAPAASSSNGVLSSSGNGMTKGNNNDDDEEMKKLQKSAEERLVLFCSKVLENAASLQTSAERVPPELHQSHTLRASVTVKVLCVMSQMSNSLFQRHLHHFYPHLNKLISSDQMDIRRALSDLFRARLVPIVPHVAPST